MRGIAIALAALAAGSAPVALFVSVAYQPDPRLAVSADESRVESVVPGGPAWNDGIRPGQLVRDLEHGSGRTEWRLVAIGADAVDFATSALSHQAALRGTAPLAAGALLLAGAAALGARRRMWRISGGVGALAVALASWPITLAAQPVISEVAAIAALVAPAAWVSMTSGRRRSRAGAAIAGVLALGWLLGRLALPALYPAAEALRVMAIGVAAAFIAWGVFPWRSWLGARPTIDTSGASEMGGVIAAALAAMLLALIFELPLWLSGASAVTAAVAFPPLRRRTVRVVDRLLLADQRELGRIAAIEEERFRVAAEIHDVPLQEISGVIRRLERTGGAAAMETELLRDVAEHLRDITGELHPPVLTDLGLGPALAAAADEANELGPPRVTFNLDDVSGILPEQRPPRSVELALFRIAHEAVTNARLHAHAATVVLTGRVSPVRIDITIRDDGNGLDPAALRAAQRRGHLGVTSMAQRAESIGGSLRIQAADPGTAVTITWSRA